MAPLPPLELPEDEPPGTFETQSVPIGPNLGSVFGFLTDSGALDSDCRQTGQCPAGEPPPPPIWEFIQDRPEYSSGDAYKPKPPTKHLGGKDKFSSGEWHWAGWGDLFDNVKRDIWETDDQLDKRSGSDVKTERDDDSWSLGSLFHDLANKLFDIEKKVKDKVSEARKDRPWIDVEIDITRPSENKDGKKGGEKALEDYLLGLAEQGAEDLVNVLDMLSKNDKDEKDDKDEKSKDKPSKGTDAA